MHNFLDLHMHSSISNDGQLSPTALMLCCKKSGLKTVALTDHNSIRGISEAKESALEIGLELIQGIELDCQIDGINLHLLGLGINSSQKEFDSIEKDLLAKEQEASSTRIQLIQDLGISLDISKVMALAINNIVTGEMIAEVVLSDSRNLEHNLLKPYQINGIRGDNPFVNFYWDFCSQGQVAYVPITYMSLINAIQLIKQSGGLAILAHPGVNVAYNYQRLENIRISGIDGIEVISSYHNENETAFYHAYTQEKHLLQTMGSDFHGKTKPSIQLGTMNCSFEAEIIYEIKRKLNTISF
ncbi:MAG: PHP domain-containing protein [Lachnospiraceae bacterium]|nr:PHP domain-containing protein [Lachnospiraceae bacterium]